jgi:hypothetical protein
LLAVGRRLGTFIVLLRCSATQHVVSPGYPVIHAPPRSEILISGAETRALCKADGQRFAWSLASSTPTIGRHHASWARPRGRWVGSARYRPRGWRRRLRGGAVPGLMLVYGVTIEHVDRFRDTGRLMNRRRRLRCSTLRWPAGARVPGDHHLCFLPPSRLVRDWPGVPAIVFHERAA